MNVVTQTCFQNQRNFWDEPVVFDHVLPNNRSGLEPMSKQHLIMMWYQSWDVISSPHLARKLLAVRDRKTTRNTFYKQCVRGNVCELYKFAYSKWHRRFWISEPFSFWYLNDACFGWHVWDVWCDFSPKSFHITSFNIHIIYLYLASSVLFQNKWRIWSLSSKSNKWHFAG